MTGYLVVDPAAGLGNIGIHSGRLRSTTDAPGNNSRLVVRDGHGGGGGGGGGGGQIWMIIGIYTVEDSHPIPPRNYTP